LAFEGAIGRDIASLFRDAGRKGMTAMGRWHKIQIALACGLSTAAMESLPGLQIVPGGRPRSHRCLRGGAFQLALADAAAHGYLGQP